jgi:hypothetical protein
MFKANVFHELQPIVGGLKAKLGRATKHAAANIPNLCLFIINIVLKLYLSISSIQR